MQIKFDDDKNEDVNKKHINNMKRLAWINVIYGIIMAVAVISWLFWDGAVVVIAVACMAWVAMQIFETAALSYVAIMRLYELEKHDENNKK